MPESSSTSPITALMQAVADLVIRVEKLEQIQRDSQIVFTPEQQILRAQCSIVGQLMGYGVPAPAAVEMAGFVVDQELFTDTTVPFPEETEVDELIEGVDDVPDEMAPESTPEESEMESG